MTVSQMGENLHFVLERRFVHINVSRPVHFVQSWISFWVSVGFWLFRVYYKM
jgi:hypothetical protein